MAIRMTDPRIWDRVVMSIRRPSPSMLSIVSRSARKREGTKTASAMKRDSTSKRARTFGEPVHDSTDGSSIKEALRGLHDSRDGFPVESDGG